MEIFVCLLQPGFSEPPHLQPVFGQRVIKGLKLSTHTWLFNVVWDLRSLPGPTSTPKDKGLPQILHGICQLLGDASDI